MNIDPSKFIGGYQEGFEAGSVKEREECIKAVEKILLELANQPIESVATKKMVIQSANIVIEGVIEAIKARGTR